MSTLRTRKPPGAATDGTSLPLCCGPAALSARSTSDDVFCTDAACAVEACGMAACGTPVVTSGAAGTGLLGCRALSAAGRCRSVRR